MILAARAPVAGDLLLNARPRRYAPAARLPFLWLCGLVLSFAYELPLWEVTQYERANPRLFDVMFVIGVLLVWPGLRTHRPSIQPFRLWAGIVLVFGICAAVTALVLVPWEYGKFSLFYAAKYAEGLICAYLAMQIPLTANQKRRIHQLVILGGLFVAMWCIPEYLVGKTVVQLTAKKTLRVPQGVIFGPLSAWYFHIGQFSVLAFAMALAFVPKARTPAASWLFVGLAAFLAWPALVCGSRASLIGVVLVLSIYVVFNKRLVGHILLLAVAGSLLWYVYTPNRKGVGLRDLSLSVRRLLDIEAADMPEGHQFRSRVLAFAHSSLSDYQHHGYMAVFGAGFYVAPVVEEGSIRYRLGYGIHNSYLFAFEQGGLLAALLFALFLGSCWRRLSMIAPSQVASDAAFGVGMKSFLFALLLMSLGGQVFWHGFNTGNMNSYIVVLLVIGCCPSTEHVCATGVALKDGRPFFAATATRFPGTRAALSPGVSIRRKRTQSTVTGSERG